MPKFFDGFTKTQQGRKIVADSLKLAISSLNKAKEELFDISKSPHRYGDQTENYLLRQKLCSHIEVLNNSISDLSTALDSSPSMNQT